MKNKNNVEEWVQSGIDQSLIKLNKKILNEEEIAEWFFQNLANSARRNDGRIRGGYLKAYKNPLKGGWGIEGYDLTNLSAEPELRTFKADHPRIGKDGKPIRYDSPRNSEPNPICPRVTYKIAAKICRQAGVNFLAMMQKYAPMESLTGIDDEAECPWFWRFAIETPQIPLTITEGGKKGLSLLSAGRLAIALTSITTWRAFKGSNRLHRWIELLIKSRECYIAFDQDPKPSTQKAVNIQSWKLGNALIKAGAARVKRISWSGTEKGIDDFIYKNLKRYGEQAPDKILDKCYDNARNYKTFQNSQVLPGKIKIVNKRYLAVKDVVEADNYRILAIKSPKGSGKTVLLCYLTAKDRANGIPTINVSLLMRLAKEQSSGMEIPYRTEKERETERNALGYSTCFDSLTPHNSVPFIPSHWADAALVLDEFTQGLRHCIFGTTEIQKYRSKVIAGVGKKLADCWKNKKPIRLVDADADAESIEFIYELIQLYSDEEVTREELEAETFVLVNEYEPEKGDLHFYHEPSPKQINLELKKRMVRQENLFVLTSAQKDRSADGSKNLERRAKKYYKDSQILRIDGKTVNDPTHLAYGLTGEELTKLIKGESLSQILKTPKPPKQLNLLEKDNRGQKAEGRRQKVADLGGELDLLTYSATPRELDQLHQKDKKEVDKKVQKDNTYHKELEHPSALCPLPSAIKIVIASPVICTGVSLDKLNGHFNAVFSFQAGNITTNAVRQQLVRLRDFLCPRYVWSPKVGKNFVGSKSTNPIQLLREEKGQARLGLGLLGYKEAEKQIESNTCPGVKYWAKVGAQQNYECYHYREILRAELETERWNIIDHYPDDEGDEVKAVWQERKEARAESIKEGIQAVVDSQDLTPTEALVLEGRQDRSEAQGKQLQKHHLKQKYGVEEVTAELVEADSKKLYPTMKLRFWLTMGRKYVEASDRAKVEKIKERNDGSFFIPDLNKVLQTPKVRLLEMLNLDKFLEEGREWSNKSPELIELSKFVFGDLIRFNQLLKCGIAITDSPITVIEKILKQTNQRLPYLRNERDGDKRLRIYGSAKSRFEKLEPQEEQMFGKWLAQCQEKFDVPQAA